MRNLQTKLFNRVLFALGEWLELSDLAVVAGQVFRVEVFIVGVVEIYFYLLSLFLPKKHLLLFNFTEVWSFLNLQALKDKTFVGLDARLVSRV